jgi:steroid 5-alpha reductase family enzyme
MKTTGRSASLGLVIFAYFVAIAVAIVMIRLFEARIGWFATGLLADVAATLVVWIFSMIYNNSSTYDPYWSVAPPLLFVYWASRAGTIGDARTTLLLAVTFIWAIRLTLNWITDWPGMGHEDWRYVNFRKSSGGLYPLVSLAAVHLFPTIIVALASLPVWRAVSAGGRPLGAWDLAGALIGLAGVFLSLLSDSQMRRFRRTGGGGIIHEGLWKISRHPNYLGEILFWVGLLFFALGASLSHIWTAMGTLAMVLMFRFASIPMMEEKILKTRPEYAKTIAAVPMLLPIPRKGVAGEKSSA